MTINEDILVFTLNIVSWLLAIYVGIKAAKKKGRSPHWVWFGILPVAFGVLAWITFLVIRFGMKTKGVENENNKSGPSKLFVAGIVLLIIGLILTVASFIVSGADFGLTKAWEIRAQHTWTNVGKIVGIIQLIMGMVLLVFGFMKNDSASGHDGSSLLDELERLGKLKSEGILTEEEFEVKKHEMMSIPQKGVSRSNPALFIVGILFFVAGLIGILMRGEILVSIVGKGAIAKEALFGGNSIESTLTAIMAISAVAMVLGLVLLIVGLNKYLGRR